MENLQAWDNRLHPFKGEGGENYFPTGLCWVLTICARSGGSSSFIEERLHLYQLSRVGRQRAEKRTSSVPSASIRAGLLDKHHYQAHDQALQGLTDFSLDVLPS